MTCWGKWLVNLSPPGPGMKKISGLNSRPKKKAYLANGKPFKLLGSPYLVGKNKPFKLLFQGPGRRSEKGNQWLISPY